MATDAASAPAGKRPVWPLVVVALLWAGLTPALVSVVALLVTAADRVAGKGAVSKSLVIATALEALVYLLVSFGVFRMARGFGAGRWYWLAGPIGYLAGAGGYALLAASAGADAGLVAPLAVIVADAVACAAGAFAGGRSAGAGGVGAVEGPSKT